VTARQKKQSLGTYRRKRDFHRTPEPQAIHAPPRKAPRGLARPGGGHAFVVQKHQASRLHYDFRLEHNGTLLSWAVPKGPSLDPSVKRLAVAVEDHPLEYAAFEGIIPEGEYGGGTVMVWDRGTYAPEGADFDRGLKDGELKFRLKGKKLKGSWVLVRTRRDASPKGGDRAWLLIKHRDGAATEEDITVTKPRSVITNRLLAEIAWDESGDAERAASGDPPAEIRKLLKNPRTRRRRRRRKPSVWRSGA
jgi:bifunctional non-homologous end joining protein LigD